MSGGRTLTYAELEEESSATARRLHALGVRECDRVATTLPPGPDFAALLHAMPKLGSILVPLNTRLTKTEMAWQIDQTKPQATCHKPLDGEQADVELKETVRADALQTALFTSGTSGTPKLVTHTYANHRASALASAWNLGVAPDDRWLCVLPLFHIGGLAILLRSAIYGTAAVVHEGFDEQQVIEALQDVSLVSLVSTMLHRLRDAGLSGAPALRAALLGGGPVPRDLLVWAAEAGLPVLQTYGMTETSSQIATLGADEALTKTGSAGRPLPDVELRIGEGGEILVRGPMVSPGAVDEDGWLHTGDRGRLDGDGFLYVEGRLGDTIVTGGENVMAAEVEDALREHPAVVDVAVVGRPDEEWGEAVTAFVVLDGEVDDAELLAHCRERLAAYKSPRAIHRVSGLPRNAAGKVVRAALAP